MKRFVFALSAVLILTLVLGAFASMPVQSASDDNNVRVLVQFQPGTRGAVEKSLKGIGAEFHYTFDELNAFAVTVPAAALNGLTKNPNVVLVEEDAPRFPIVIEKSSSATVAALTGQTVPYGVDMVQARDVWDTNRDSVVDSGAVTGANRKICIIDSGVYTGHEDLQGVNVSGYSGNLPWNVDGSGHGTHVSGTIAAMNNALGVVGVTPGTVQVYMVRVFGDDGAWAYSSTLIDAANKCYAAGANIISMSLGGGQKSRTEQVGFDSLYSKGVLSIAAAGNEGTSALSYPASYTSVVSVAAIDENKVVADFSQFNSSVELAAPGVGVLSTVPYLDSTSLTVDSVAYAASHIEYSARGNATGALVNGGLCDATGSWSGKVVLCERGVIDFYTKVMNVQNSGGAAAVIYNNVPGGFLGTLGEGYFSTIIGISLSQEDGQYLVANKLGTDATISSTYTAPASSYEYYDGTSMATPHASAVAALVWSADPTATNVEVRNALTSSAEDLGTAGRDVYYGFGLVQAADAIVALTGGGGTTDGEIHVAALTSTKTLSRNKWTATVTTSVKDANDAPVTGVVVSGAWSNGFTGTGTCTTGSTGTCSITSGSMKLTVPSVLFTVTNLSLTGYTYNPAANAVSSITVYK